MHDRDDEETPIKTLGEVESVKPLERLIVLQQKLQEKLSEDRNAWAVTGGDLAEAVDTLQIQIKKFEMMDTQLGKRLAQAVQEEMRKSAQTVASAVSQVIKETTTKQVEESLRELDYAIQNTKNKLAGYESEVRHTRWKLLAVGVMAAILGGLISGGLIHHFFPTQSFTEAQ